MRVAADGYIDLRDGRMVRTPPAPRNPKPELIQVIQYQHWSYQDGW